jgi:hypothetical protein
LPAVLARAGAPAGTRTLATRVSSVLHEGNAMEPVRDLVPLKPPRRGRMAPSLARLCRTSPLTTRAGPLSRQGSFCGTSSRAGADGPRYGLTAMACCAGGGFLLAVGGAWDQAGPAKGRDYVLWLSQAGQPIAGRRKRPAATPGRRRGHRVGGGRAARVVHGRGDLAVRTPGLGYRLAGIIPSDYWEGGAFTKPYEAIPVDRGRQEPRQLTRAASPAEVSRPRRPGPRLRR